jgi:hypothetical protein
VLEQAKAISSTTFSTSISKLPFRGANEVKDQLFEAFENTIYFDATSMKGLGKRPGDGAFFA